MASAWGWAWGKAWGPAWGRLRASAGALAGQRPAADTQRPPDPATSRLYALQTTARTATTPDTQRPDALPTDRPTITAAPRAATRNTSRRAQAGGTRN